ncbi:unnamed protein product, partial [Rotaria magnacalcarata]
KLEVLNLPRNKIHSPGLLTLVNALKYNTTLMILNLQLNSIDDDQVVRQLANNLGKDADRVFW